MFRLVRDVPAYPEFLSWCIGSEVHEQTADYQLATLVVKVSGMTQRFTTRNRFVPGERLTLSLAGAELDLSLVGSLRMSGGDEERRLFIDRFWARRDPDPRSEVNQYRMTFWTRRMWR